MGIRTKRIYQKRTKLPINEHDRRVDLGATEKQLQLVARAKLIWTRGDHVEIQRSNYSAIVPSVCRTDWTTTAIPAARKQLNQLTMYKRDRAWPRRWDLTPGPPHYKPGGGGYSQKNWVGVCGPLPKTLTLFMTKICDFPYPIYDLTKNLIPYLWPDP